MIEVHSKTHCPYCRLAKDYLDKHGLPFTEILHDNPADRQALYDVLGLVGGQRTVPQVFVEQAGVRERVGGYADLLRADLPQRLKGGVFDARF